MEAKSGIAGVILAGGRGERLGGVVKANLTIGGVRLLERVAAGLAGADAVLVALGAFLPNEIGLLPRQIAVPDLDNTSYRGPLAGLAAAAAWATAQPERPDYLLSAAVDTPFLPKSFTSGMATAIEPGRAAVVARHGAQDYPTNAIWRVERVADLPARMAAGSAPRSLRALAAELNAATLTWPDSDGGDPFANVNTPADIAELERRAETADTLSGIGHSGLGNAGQTR
jgi:molybdopterin-guanine dinucleotide biosynthesis protein A